MKSTTKLSLVLVISTAFFVTEIAIGFRTKSLALIADAVSFCRSLWDMLMSPYRCDCGADVHAPQTPEFSYAFHRGELVGAFFNGVFLLALALSIFLQAVERFVNIQPVDNPLFVLIVGGVGLALNILSVLIVHEHHGHSHGHAAQEDDESSTLEMLTIPPLIGHPNGEANVHKLHNHANVPATAHAPQHNYGLLAVMIHLFGDAVNNVGVMVAAVIMWKLSSPARFYADPAVSVIISAIIFASALPLTKKSARILLEAAPPGLNLNHLMEDLLAVPGVLSIHDMHVWQLSQSITLASFHVRVATNTDLLSWEHTEENLHQCCAAYGISHATIAPEVQHDAGPCGHGAGARAGEHGADDEGAGGSDSGSSRGRRGNARARAACDEGFGCAADDRDLFQLRKRAGRSVGLQ
ncbi:putative CDF zinc transporter [Hygrophoropsis aurantiaca]|uniref:CDF zinc transporter n=1 Tax=Hygrophoropsis aurantiaca TaxID=72124 RepID=A0ACB8A043_9AGAM|nr:putative CDF zinc transporter [Hygrophoropsis aurantiaca]